MESLEKKNCQNVDLRNLFQIIKNLIQNVEGEKNIKRKVNRHFSSIFVVIF